MGRVSFFSGVHSIPEDKNLFNFRGSIFFYPLEPRVDFKAVYDPSIRL